LPYHTTDEGNTTKEEDSTSLDTPPPTFFSSHVELVSENITEKKSELSQQLFNTTSTVIQQPQNVEEEENAPIVYEIKNTENEEFIQHTTKNEGERGCVEQSQFDDVLQISQSVHSTTTTEDSAYQTNSQNPTSQQEAFQQKYQPVEVLNRCFSSGVDLTAESITGNGEEVSQQLFNTYSTLIKHPEIVDQ
jgi:hypothetical protein